MSSWQRLWLQTGDPAFEVPSDDMRRDLAQIWATHDAVKHLGEAMEFVTDELNVRLCELATSSLRDRLSFDDGYWHAAAHRARSVGTGAVPRFEIPDLISDESDPVELMAEILARVGPGRSGVVAPVAHLNLKAERSRPGWQISGLPDTITLPEGATHLGAFAIDEGDNEVLAIIPSDAVATSVDLTEDEVVKGLHERARLEDRLTVAALVRVLRSMQPCSDDTSRLKRAMAHATVLAATAALQRTLTVRAQAVSSAVTFVASGVDLVDLQPDPDWHLTRLVTLL